MRNKKSGFINEILSDNKMAPKKLYTPEQMARAVEAVIKRGEKVGTAASLYGVPRITLRNKVTGKSPIECNMGPQTILTNTEEKILVKWLIHLSDKHFPIGKEQLLDSVQKIIIDTKRPNPFTNNRPGKKWYKSFLHLHPELSQRTAQNLTTERNSVKEKDIHSWFDEVQKYLRDNNLLSILNDPSRIFNADESAFFLQPKAGQVLTRKGDKNVYSASGNEKKNLTVLITANASGQLAPPMIVFSYERIPNNIAMSVPEDWGIGKSETGWMCSDTFYCYITNVFHPWLLANKISLPVSLFLDGHASHMTFHLSEFCSKNGIEVIALYPNSTHILQPMDLAVFRPLKSAWKHQVTLWKTQHLGQQLRIEDFAPVFKLALMSISEQCIKNGFKAGGLSPFGTEHIDFSKIHTRNREAEPTEKEHPPGQTVFFKTLEAEIVKIFSYAKLDLFNKLYYENRTTLENLLPDEDQSLYAIWAKYKHLTHCVIATKSPNINSISNNAGPGTEESILESEIEVIPTKQCLTGDVIMLSGVDALNPNENNTLNKNLTKLYQELECVKKTVVDNSVVHTVDQSAKDLTVCDDESGSVKTALVDTLVPSTSAINTNYKTPEKNITNHSNAISTTSSLVPVDDFIIPSPFKRALYWPEPDKKKRRIIKEKIPPAVTSKSFRDYCKKKEEKKKALQEQKEKRAAERLEKKKLREQIAEEKKIRNLKCKINKNIKDDFSSDSESLSEVEYAESSKSEWEENDSEYEDLIPVFKEDIKKGQFVIVLYEVGKRKTASKKFLSIVEEVEGNEVKVISMKASDSSNLLFNVVESDSSYVTYDQILGSIGEPSIILRGERIYYKFNSKIDLR